MNLVKKSGHCVWLGLGVEYSLHTVLREQLEGGPLGKVFSVSPGRSMHLVVAVLHTLNGSQAK